MPDGSLVAFDLNAAAFLHRSTAGRTSWHWLSALEACGGVPSDSAAFVRSSTNDTHDMQAKAWSMLRRGMIGNYQEMLEIAMAMEAQRARIIATLESRAKRDVQMRDALSCHRQTQKADSVAARVEVRRPRGARAAHGGELSTPR